MIALPKHLLAAVACLAAGCGPSVVVDVSAGGCPAVAPEVSSPCAGALVCGYAGAPCGGSFTCAGGVWQPAQGGCHTPPGPCPAKLPSAGAPCKSPGQACTFTFPGSCGGVFVATCGDAAQWAITDQTPPCMPPAGCAAHGTASDCAADAGCAWLVPGCGAPPVMFPAGCFPSASCTSNADCQTGLSCQMVTFDPCWNKGCDACSATRAVCL